MKFVNLIEIEKASKGATFLVCRVCLLKSLLQSPQTVCAGCRQKEPGTFL